MENTRKLSLLEEYKSRINRVIDYIENNLDKSLTLEELAEIAHFSKFHFHRIFFSLIGERLNQFIQRLRLERAAILLITNQRKTVTEIALECGFSSSSVFARSFKEYFTMSASQWRLNHARDHSNICTTERMYNQTFSNLWKDDSSTSVYIEYKDNSQIWRLTMNNKERTVEVKDLPKMTVAYVRHIGPYKGDPALFERLSSKLFQWAGPRNLLKFPATKYLIVYHDNPEITNEDKLRLSICITVDPVTEVSGEIGKMEIPSGMYALCRFEIKADEFQEAWNHAYGVWLPQSGYEPDDRPCFELYHNDHKEHPEKKFILDICIPVKPMK
jgi:AraC family transcriptional regulator